MIVKIIVSLGEAYTLLHYQKMSLDYWNAYLYRRKLMNLKFFSTSRITYDGVGGH